MSRPWRIEYEVALYHLLSRGNEPNDIFIDDKDRGDFLLYPSQSTKRRYCQTFRRLPLEQL